MAKPDDEVKDQGSGKDIAAEENEDDGEAKPKAKKRRGKKLLILGIVVPVLLLGGGGGAYFMGLFGGEKENPAEAKKKKKAEERKKVVYYELPEMLVNLNAADNRTHYLKISVSLELADKEQIATIQTMLPRIIDNFQVYLRELRVEDLRGSAGLYRLREELLTRVNKAAAPARITDVLFKEMLVQ